MELESMRTKYGVCKRERSPSRLDAFVKSLEEERDYYRQEVECYRRVRGAGSPTRSPTRGRSSWSNVRRVRKKDSHFCRSCLCLEVGWEEVRTRHRDLVFSGRRSRRGTAPCSNGER